MSAKYVLIYTNQSGGFVKGREFRYANPDWFDSLKKDASRVVVVGNYPSIVAAYKNEGIPVVVADEFDPKAHSLDALEGKTGEPKKAEPVVEHEAQKAPAPAAPPPAPAGAVTVEIPANWEKLPWTHEDPTQTIRHIATQLTTAPVINRGQAQKIVREELERRGGASSEPQG